LILWANWSHEGAALAARENMAGEFCRESVGTILLRSEGTKTQDTPSIISWARPWLQLGYWTGTV